VGGEAVFAIETRYHEVADAALGRGFDMVNDVCGFADPEMPRVCAEYEAAVVKMASPPNLECPGGLETVEEIYDALGRAGFTDKTIIDPAFGGWTEGKTLADDRETFRRLREFRGLGRPILVSINRKNFLRKLAGRSTEAALPVSLAATSMAVERGAHVIRTHDVAETRDAAIVGDTFTPERVRDDAVSVEELDVRTARELDRHLERVEGAGDPGRGIARAFALHGLSPDGRESLEAALAGTDLLCTGRTDSIVLAGPATALSTVPHPQDAPATLRAALDRVRKACG
jgi:dihydropteroate synthase